MGLFLLIIFLAYQESVYAHVCLFMESVFVSSSNIYRTENVKLLNLALSHLTVGTAFQYILTEYARISTYFSFLSCSNIHPFYFSFYLFFSSICAFDSG